MSSLYRMLILDFQDQKKKKKIDPVVFQTHLFDIVLLGGKFK